MRLKRVIGNIVPVQSLRDYLAVRKKDGLYRRNLRRACRRLLRAPTGINRKVFGVHLLRMLLGDRLMNAVLSDAAVVITGEYRAAQEGAQLYHYAPSDCVERIRSNGLLPKDRFVYLTDAPEEYARTFLPWKTQQIRKPTAYALLQMDAQRLTAAQSVFRTDRAHEFVTGKIDAALISVLPDVPVEPDLK